MTRPGTRTREPELAVIAVHTATIVASATIEARTVLTTIQVALMILINGFCHLCLRPCCRTVRSASWSTLLATSVRSTSR